MELETFEKHGETCTHRGWIPPMKLGASFASTAFCSGATALFQLASPQLHGPAGPKELTFTASIAQSALWFTPAANQRTAREP
jgi:hypothetical protein